MKVIVSRRKNDPFRRSRAELVYHSRSSNQNADESLPSDVDEAEQNIEFNDDRKSPDCDISSYVEAILDDPKDSQSESHESAIDGNDSTQMETGDDAEPEFVSTNNLPRLSVSNQLTSRRSKAKDALSDGVEQTDRVDKSGDSIRRKKKQTRGRVKRFNNYVDTEKDAAVRENKFSLRINLKESRTFACTECEKRFNHKGHLEEHFRIHTREKPFACTECGFAFSQKGHLKAHQRTHSGERPFECPVCNVSFSQKSNLTHHLLIHKNERPYTCELCQRSFRRRDRLTHHMRTHGEKPHKCEICQKTFRQRSHLVSHFSKIHGQILN